MGPAQLGLASWKWERLDRRLWEIQQEASKSSSENPSRGTFPAATGLPPAPLRIPRAGKTGRRLGHGRGGGLGRWARESPLVGRKHPWVSRPGGQMQGNSGLRKHPAVPPPLPAQAVCLQLSYLGFPSITRPSHLLGPICLPTSSSISSSQLGPPGPQISGSREIKQWRPHAF